MCGQSPSKETQFYTFLQTAMTNNPFYADRNISLELRVAYQERKACLRSKPVLESRAESAGRGEGNTL